MKKKQLYSSDFQFLFVLFFFLVLAIYLLANYFVLTKDQITVFKTSVLNLNKNNLPSTSATGGEVKVTVYDIFTDVSSDHANAKAIEYLKDYGIISGFDDGSFRPDEEISRADLVVLAGVATNIDLTGTPYKDCFVDVKNEWFAPYVCYAKEHDWVVGAPDGRFAPLESVSLVEVLKVLTKAFELVEVDNFNKTLKEFWYDPYLKIATEEGLIFESDNPDLSRKVQRGEIAKMIYLLMRKR